MKVAFGMPRGPTSAGVVDAAGFDTLVEAMAGRE